MTSSYTPTNWQTGDTITQEKLNKAELGIQSATAGVVALESATAEATALEAGSSPTASFDGKKWAFGIPAGATGPQGPKGDTGEQGPAGAAGSSKSYVDLQSFKPPALCRYRPRARSKIKCAY